jgi:hypothetical protein
LQYSTRDNSNEFLWVGKVRGDRPLPNEPSPHVDQVTDMRNNNEQLHKPADVDGSSERGILTLAVVVKLPGDEVDPLLDVIRNHSGTRIIHYQTTRGNLWITR